ncbi:putative transposase [Pseudarthrobacter sp. H2]|uniref:putative transposase n=1 Tax=Pseudarthrobacter sp. H2 TaxID=3418415 RepID=UPI003CECF543
MHFDLDSPDAYASTDEDPDRLVPNPAKAKSYQKVVAARKHHADVAAETNAALMAARTPPADTDEVIVASAMHNAVMAPLWEAESALDQAEAAHAGIPARVRLGDLAPSRQVLDTEVKLITHAIRMAAYNAAMTIAWEIRTNTGYKRAADETPALMRQAFNQPGDIGPTVPGFLTIRLDPLPTKRATKAIDELCAHLTSTETRYPGTGLTLKFAIKNNTPTSRALNRQVGSPQTARLRRLVSTGSSTDSFFTVPTRLPPRHSLRMTPVSRSWSQPSAHSSPSAASTRP